MIALSSVSRLPFGPLVRWATGSRSSHFAVLLFDSVILQSDFFGVHFTPVEIFLRSSRVTDSVEIPFSRQGELEYVRRILVNYLGRAYDWKWFFSLAYSAMLWKVMGRPIPDHVRWQSRAKYLCTELALTLGLTDIGSGLPDSVIARLKVLYPPHPLS